MLRGDSEPPGSAEEPKGAPCTLPITTNGTWWAVKYTWLGNLRKPQNTAGIFLVGLR